LCVNLDHNYVKEKVALNTDKDSVWLLCYCYIYG